MKKNNRFLLYSIIVSIILFGLCVYRAATTGLTYDEAFTYIKYVQDNPFAVVRYLFSIHTIVDNYSFFVNPIASFLVNLTGVHIIGFLISMPFEALKELIQGHLNVFANNHILNTFLISLVQRISGVRYNEFLIRLPNIIFYSLYFIFAYLLCNKYKHKYLCFNLLVFNYGVHEFFGLARGYGISCSLALIGIYFFKIWYDSKDKYMFLNISYLIMALSCYANTTSLLIFASVIAISQIYIFINKGIKENFTYIIKNIFMLIPIGLISLIIVFYHFSVSSDGLPLFGGSTGFFKDVLVSVWEEYGVTFYPSIITILILLILGVILYIYRKELLKKPIIYIAVAYFIFLICLTIGFHQLWLTARLLVPAIPLLMLSIFEIIDVVDINKYVMIGLVIISIIPFLVNLDVTKTRDWDGSYIVREKAYETYEKKDNEIMRPYLDDETVYFYREKIKYYYDYDILDGLFN